MTEKRRFNRQQLYYYMGVFDDTDGRFIGYLADINLEGAMILSNAPVAVNILYNLKIEPLVTPSSIAPFRLKATCVRCNMDKLLDFYDCGFSFTDLIPEVHEIIMDLIEKYRCIDAWDGSSDDILAQ